MSFLELNGMTLETVKGGSSAPNLIGSVRERAYDGTLLSSRRAIKRRWQHTLRQKPERHIEMIRGLILGTGHNWNYDSDLFSGKGLGPGATSANVIKNVADDGATVGTDIDGFTEAQYGNGSIQVSADRTNLLSDNQANVETDTTGFSAVSGAAIARNTSNFFRDTASIQVITAGAEGVETDAVGASAATLYYAQVWVKATSAATITLRLIDSTAASSTTGGVVMVANEWKFFYVAHTTAGGATTIRMELLSSAAATFYIDQLQIEENDYPSAWILPSTGASGAEDLEYDAIGTMANVTSGITLGAWIRSPTSDTLGPSSFSTFLKLGGETVGENQMMLRRGSTTNEIVFVFFDEDNNSTSITYSTAPWDGDWHHVAAVFRQNAETGEAIIELFFDGVSVGTGSPGADLDSSEITKLQVGHDSATGYMAHSRMDDVILLPFAVEAAYLLGVFGMGVAYPNIPRLRATGDFIARDSVTVEGEERQSSISGFQEQTAAEWKNNAQTIQFSLEEA